MSGTSDASTSASSGTDSLEDTLGSTQSNQFSFGTSNNQTIVDTSNAAARGVPAPGSPDGSSAVKMKLGELQTETKLEGEMKPGATLLEQPQPLSATTSPGSEKPDNMAGDDDDDGDNEFTFGTSQPLQMPDLSHVPKPKLPPHVEEDSTLRQAGHNKGECRDLALLTTISEVPPRPRSPPPSTIVPPPPSGMHPHPYVSPRLSPPHLNRAHTTPWNYHMQASPSPQQQGFPSHPASPMMYASHPGMVYDPSAAYNQVAIYDAASAQAAQAQAQYQYQCQAEAQFQSEAQYQADAQAAQSGGYDLEAGYADTKGHADTEHLEADAEFDTQEMPLAIKIAFMLEACCAECSNCKHLELKKIAAFGCGLVLIGGGVAMIALMASSRWS